MANGILGMIANPPRADIPGALAKRQVLQSNKMKMGQERDKAELKMIGMDIVAAAMMQGDKQTQMLNQILGKTSQGSIPQKLVQSIVNTPEGKQRDKNLFMAVELLQQGKITPPKQETGVTPEQKERELRVKEKGVELREQELSARLKEIDLEEKYGKVPSGYRRTEDGRIEPIPGGKEEAKQQQIEKALVKSVKSTMDKSQIVLSNIDEALEMVGPFTAGFGGSLFSKIAGAPAFDLSEVIDTVKANIGFEALNQMRQQSPTGGALGQVSERELAQLERTLGSLNTRQSPQKLTKKLNEIKNIYSKVLDGAKTDFSQIIQPLQPTQPMNQPKAAPKEAIDFLMQNPVHSEAFKQKYGYLPEGL